MAKVSDTGLKADWSAFEKIFGSSGGYESEFALPRRWDGKDIYSDLDDLLKEYLKKVAEIIPELKGKTENVCGKVREMLRLYLHGYPSDAYAVMRRLMEELDENPLYVDVWKIENLYRMSSVPENIDDKPRIFHAPYNIRPKIRTYRYSIAGYPSLYLADSLKLADEEMHLFKENKNAIAARFEFDSYFINWNPTKILEFSFRPQDLASGRKTEENCSGNEGRCSKEKSGIKTANDFRGCFQESVCKANDIKEKHSRKKGLFVGPLGRENSTLLAPERYMLWYPLIAACSYVRTSRNDPFAPEYVVPQLLAQWMRSESTGELVGIRYFSCFSSQASEVGCNYVFPTSGDPIILKDGVRLYCPVLNEAFKFTHTEFLPEYAGKDIGKIEEALQEKKAERAFGLTREDYKEEIKVELPAEFMYLAARSFKDCAMLKHIVNMGNVVNIGDGAFDGCESLALTKLPEGLKSIGDRAFKGCTSLALTKLPEGLKSIGDDAFYQCTNLALTELPNGLKRISVGAFYGCVGLKLKKLPDGLKSIGEGAFYGCTRLKIARLPEGLTSIGWSAFNGCASLKLKKLPGGIRSIGVSAFSGCTNLALKELPKELKRIGDGVFSGCASLKLTELPEDLTSIGGEAFYGCTSLALTKIPDGLTRIERRAFLGCTGLKLTELPEKLASIGVRAFSDCTSLALKKLPEGLISIGEMAFSGCSSITEIALPKSLTKIGDAVFAGCADLKNISYSGTKEQWLKINKDKEWDYGTPKYTFHFGDGTVMNKKELHVFEDGSDQEEEQGE